MIYKELKKEIINWLIENENMYQRVNNCVDAFKQYIFNDKGNFIIGGDDVHMFIIDADALIYNRK